MTKYLLSFVLMFSLLSGCANKQLDNPVYFNQISLINQSDHDLQNVKIQVPATGGIVFCNYVSRSGYCSNRFKAKPYQGNLVNIEWQSAGRQWRQQLTPGDYMPENVKGVVLVELHLQDQGRFDVKVIPALRP